MVYSLQRTFDTELTYSPTQSVPLGFTRVTDENTVTWGELTNLSK